MEDGDEEITNEDADKIINKIEDDLQGGGNGGNIIQNKVYF